MFKKLFFILFLVFLNTQAQAMFQTSDLDDLIRQGPLKKEQDLVNVKSPNDSNSNEKKKKFFEEIITGIKNLSLNVPIIGTIGVKEIDEEEEGFYDTERRAKKEPICKVEDKEEEKSSYAYNHANKKNFQSWFDDLEEGEKQAALAHIAKRAKDEKKRNHNVENYPENIFKMMLRFTERNKFKNDFFEIIETCETNEFMRYHNIPFIRRTRFDLKTGKLDASNILWEHGLPFLKNLLYAAATLHSDAIKHIDLSGNALNEIPISQLQHFPNLESLDLSYNQLSTIHDLRLPKLRKLILHTNKITSVANFTRMPNLQVLDLCQNQLTAVPEFDRLQRLQVLYIALNKLTRVPNFAHRHLEKLYLSDNLLASIHNFNLPNLLELRLDHNKLPVITNFTYLRKLRQLLVSRNELTELPRFTHLPRNCEIYY